MEKKKTNIVFTCRKLQALHKGCYNFKNSPYKNSIEVIKDIEYIIPYGDISSVRKACEALSDFYFIEVNKPLIPKISLEKQKILKQKKELKSFSVPTFNKRNGKFLVYFD